MRQRLPTAERRTQIADAALRLLAEHGAAQLTAARIAQAVGVTDASLFRHFANMEAIVDAAIARFGEALATSLQRPERDPIDRLRAFFVHRQTLLRARPELLRLAFNDRLADVSGDAGAAQIRAIVSRSRQFLRDCLSEGQAAGHVRADLPVAVLLWTVSGVMRGAAMAGHDRPVSNAAEPGPHASPCPEDAWRDLWRLLAVQTEPMTT